MLFGQTLWSSGTEYCLWSQNGCYRIPISHLAGWLTLGESFNLCVPCFPSGETEIIIVAISKDYSDN